MTRPSGWARCGACGSFVPGARCPGCGAAAPAPVAALGMLGAAAATAVGLMACYGMPICPDDKLVDLDGDGAFACADGGKEVVGPPADCDDRDATRRPGVWDAPGDGIDQDCDGVDGTRGATTASGVASASAVVRTSASGGASAAVSASGAPSASASVSARAGAAAPASASGATSSRRS